MARYRGIKYDYFNDKKVSELSFMGRLLFIGIWTECDDAGVESREEIIKQMLELLVKLQNLEGQ